MKPWQTFHFLSSSAISISFILTQLYTTGSWTSRWLICCFFTISLWRKVQKQKRAVWDMMKPCNLWTGFKIHNSELVATGYIYEISNHHCCLYLGSSYTKYMQAYLPVSQPICLDTWGLPALNVEPLAHADMDLSQLSWSLQSVIVDVPSGRSCGPYLTQGTVKHLFCFRQVVWVKTQDLDVSSLPY